MTLNFSSCELRKKSDDAECYGVFCAFQKAPCRERLMAFDQCYTLRI